MDGMEMWRLGFSLTISYRISHCQAWIVVLSTFEENNMLLYFLLLLLRRRHSKATYKTGYDSVRHQHLDVLVQTKPRMTFSRKRIG